MTVLSLTLTLTPEHLDDLEGHLARHRGAIALATLSAFDTEGLNALRYALTLQRPEAPAFWAGAATTVDALVDHVVAEIARSFPAMRVRPPEDLTDAAAIAHWAQVRAAFLACTDENGGPGVETMFYVDGEAEPMDDGELFDVYEELLFDEEGMDEDEGEWS